MGIPHRRGIGLPIICTLQHPRTNEVRAGCTPKIPARRFDFRIGASPLGLRARRRRVSVLRDPGYMEWLKERPCVACMKRAVPVGPCSWWRLATIDPAHTLNNGFSSKGPDSSCIPLCRYHHDEMDGRLSTATTTKEQFAAKYGLDLANESAAHYAMYLAGEGDQWNTLSTL